MSEGVERNEDNVNGFAIAVVGISVAIVLYASIVALQAYYKQSENPEDLKRQSANQSDAMRNLRASQQAELNESKYVGGSEFASIPLSDAMKKVVADERAHKPSLVPVVPAHDKATVPAIPGKPIEGGDAAGAVDGNAGDSAGGEEQAEEGSGSAESKPSAEEGKGGEDKAAKGKDGASKGKDGASKGKDGAAKGKTEGKAKSKTKGKAAKDKDGAAKGKTEGKAKSKTKGKAAKGKDGAGKAKPEAKKAKEEAKPSN